MPDVNLISYGPQDDHKRIDLKNAVVNGTGYDDAIKFSRVNDFILYVNKVISGREDAIDINNESKFVSVHANKLHLGGELGITIKGGSENIVITAEIVGDGIIELGGWSDQSKKRTKNVRLLIRRSDGQKQKIRVLDADKPDVKGVEVEYLFPSPNMGSVLHGFFVWGFKTLRKLGLWRD